jgi:predicted nuclease of predicted toxin-antitoxin system
MKFLLDENVSYRVASHLKTAGHDAIHVSEIGLTSTDDSVILARARGESRVLLSGDHDFVQMLFASGDALPSLVLVREVETMPAAELAALVVAALAAGLEEPLATGAIATLTPSQVRYRPLPLRPTASS